MYLPTAFLMKELLFFVVSLYLLQQDMIRTAMTVRAGSLAR